MGDLPALRIGICGLGLIGGSLALALGRAWPHSLRRGFDHDPSVTARARAQGVIDEVAPGLEELLAGCDLVVLCQPMGALLDSLSAAASAPRLPVVCDVASVKSPVLARAAKALGRRRGRFVGAHPIAGKAQCGLEAADARLFAGRPVVLCLDGADDDAIASVRGLWRAVGARDVALSAALHDEVYAALSHLPQLLTWTYLRTLARESWRDQARSLAGPGFESFTRLGESDARLWTEIALQNRAPLLERIDHLADALQDLRRVLARGDVDEVFLHLELARGSLGAHPG